MHIMCAVNCEQHNQDHTQPLGSTKNSKKKEEEVNLIYEKSTSVFC